MGSILQPSVLACDAESAPSVSMAYVRALIETVEEAGVPPTRLLQATHFDGQGLAEVEARVPITEFHRLCESALELTGDDALGLHMSEALSGRGCDLIANLVAHASTLGQALRTRIQLQKLVSDACSHDLIECEDHITLRYQRPCGVSASVARLQTELHLTNMYRLFLYFNRARPTQICFEHPAPAYRFEYSRIFAGAERFEQPFDGLIFERALMNVPSPSGDQELYASLRALADSRLARIVRVAGYSQRVREVISQNPRLARGGMRSVARVLRLSTRSLRRRLTEEGTGYHTVASEVSADIAKRMLLVERRTIEETAHSMGYSSPSVFHRAFKRWTGATPGAYRSHG